MPIEAALDTENFVIKINKKRVKQIAVVLATITGVGTAVYLARNLSVEKTEDSVVVELETA